MRAGMYKKINKLTWVLDDFFFKGLKCSPVSGLFTGLKRVETCQVEKAHPSAAKAALILRRLRHDQSRALAIRSGLFQHPPGRALIQSPMLGTRHA